MMEGPGNAIPVFHSVYPADITKCDGAFSFLQSGFWGTFKACFGWNARSFIVDWGRGIKLPLLVIRRRLPLGLSFAYVPWGPEIFPFPELELGDTNSEQFSKALLDLALALKKQLPQDTAFIRFDPPWPIQGSTLDKSFLTGKFKRAGADIQAPDTTILDLGGDEEDLLAGMKPKWRYNIGLAQRKGVVVRRLDEAGLTDFYKLYLSTAKRDKIAIHSLDYYRILFQHAKEYGEGNIDLRLYVAFHEKEVLAAIIILIRKKEATYLYGASADHKRNLMAPYSLQWQAIKDARDAGCARYDFFGIPPQEDPRHPMAGLYRFKLGFGGRVVHRLGSWDYPYKPLLTTLFRYVEGLRRWLRSMRKTHKHTEGKQKGD